MFKHILVPIDFAEPAHHALDMAIELADRFGSHLSILHVYPAAMPMEYGTGLVWPNEQIAAGARAALNERIIRAKTRYTDCDGVLMSGLPSDEINAFARKSAVDLIVMGTHGRRDLPPFMVGSTTERVVRTSHVPVLTVPVPSGDAAQPR